MSDQGAGDGGLLGAEPGGEKDRGKRERPAGELLTAAQIKSRIRQLLDGAGAAAEEFGDPYCGGILQSRAEALAEAWGGLASRNKNVRRMLSGLLTGSDWTQAIVLTLGTAVPMLAHHGWVPAGMARPFTLGLVVPSPSDEVGDHARREGAPPTASKPAPGYPGPEPAPEPEPAPPAPGDDPRDKGATVSEVGPEAGDGGNGRPSSP